MNCEIHAAVYGSGDDLVLIPLPADERSRLAREYATANGLPYCGAMAFVEGKCSARCEPGADAVSTMMSAAPHFAQYVHARLGKAELLALSRIHNWSELT